MSDYLDRYMDAEAEVAEQAAAKRQKLREQGKGPKSVLALDDNVMSKAAAIEVTDSIRASATATYILVKRAHDYQAWKAMGYPSWTDYVVHEFDMTASRSYQLINQANVISEIEKVVPEGSKITLTEKQARDIKNELPRITEKIAATDVDSDNANDVVNDVVNDVREQKRKKSEPKDKDPLDDFGPVDENPASKLDKKSKADAPDRLPVSRSGSTADDPVDLDAPIGVGTGVDADFTEPAIDDSDNDVVALQFVFSSVSTLGNPYDVAKKFSGDKKALVKNVRTTIDWLEKFQKSIGDAK